MRVLARLTSSAHFPSFLVPVLTFKVGNSNTLQGQVVKRCKRHAKLDARPKLGTRPGSVVKQYINYRRYDSVIQKIQFGAPLRIKDRKPIFAIMFLI